MEETYTFIEWNYETGTATEYRRDGDCNQCGQCCMTYISFFAGKRSGKNNHNGGSATDGVGVWNEVRNQHGTRRYFKINEINHNILDQRCPMLRRGNKPGEYACSVQKTKLRICKSWPMSPSQVEPFDKCSYTFVPVRSWKFDDFTSGAPKFERAKAKEIYLERIEVPEEISQSELGQVIERMISDEF